MSDDWARPVVHWDLRARDPEVLGAFYGELFNWPVGAGPIKRIPAGIGGPEPGPGGHIHQDDRVGVTLYIQVLDIKATLTKAGELGGKVITEPFPTPGGGPTMARITDPEGNLVMLVQQ